MKAFWRKKLAGNKSYILPMPLNKGNKCYCIFLNFPSAHSKQVCQEQSKDDAVIYMRLPCTDQSNRRMFILSYCYSPTLGRLLPFGQKSWC